ncbi:MAG: DNA polymerase III subunit gamma/tau [Candidatus Andersenbacteria bacterium]
MAGLALYRKYRPQRFADVIGQTRVTATLQQALKQGSVAHAYLFAGPRGTGKTSVARLLARAVNCSARTEGRLATGEPCNTCAACLRAQQGRELDLIEIDAASNRGIDEIRELRERVRFAPSGQGKKVFLIDEVHMLTKEAFNALLKTLEEPPAHAIFILATTEVHTIPATILSRVQQFSFSALPVTALVDSLAAIAKKESIQVEPAALELLATLAEGGARDAQSLLDVVAAAASKKVTLESVRTVLALPPQKRFEEWVAAVSAADVRAGLALLHTSYESGTDMLHLARGLVRYVRLVLLAQVDPAIAASAAPYLTAEQRTTLQNAASTLTRAQAIRAITLLNQAALELRTASLPLLPLEVATIQLCDRLPAPPLGSKAGTPLTVAAVRASSTKRAKPISTNLAQTARVKKSADVEPADPELLQTLIAGWSDALASVRSKNVSVGSLLKQAVLLRVSKSKAWFVVEYPFHRERIMSRTNRHLIEETLEARFKRKVQLICLVPSELTRTDVALYAKQKQALQTQTKKAEPLADLALNLLGGQVVE